MSKRNKVLLGGGGAVLLIVLVMVSASAKREKGIEVRFETVGRRDLVAAVTASGKIQPKKKVDISADITGRITRIAVREGDFVQKGQFLLQIDPTIYQANLQRAQAAMSQAEAGAVQARATRDQSTRALQRTKELREQNPNLISQEQLEQAQTASDISEANLTAASAVGGSQSDRAVDYEVEITLSNPPSEVRPDLSATARIVTDTRKQALAIPIIALTVRENTPISTEQRPERGTAQAATPTPADSGKRGQGGNKKEAEGVFLVHNGVATFHPVKVGIAGEEHFEVVEGVHPGDTIVAGPYQAIRDLKEGARVRPSRESSDTTGRRRS